MREHKGPRFAAVWAAVSEGQHLINAVKDHGVSLDGYRKWCDRHNFQPRGKRTAPPNSAFKAAEREIRQGKIFFVAQKYGVEIIDIYRRKKATGAERDLLERAFAEVEGAPSTESICKKHGITKAQLYSWRHATGGLPKTPPLCESAS